MSDDLIKRSDAIGAITNHCEYECYYRVDHWCPQCQREEFEEAIKAVPSADRPQGEWMWHEDEDICNCSECEFEIDATGCIEPMEYVGVFHFCPNCGADMREREGE